MPKICNFPSKCKGKYFNCEIKTLNGKQMLMILVDEPSVLNVEDVFFFFSI
jgi:hypothetical protein